jgi:signal transduction histidine kinase
MPTTIQPSRAIQHRVSVPQALRPFHRAATVTVPSDAAKTRSLPISVARELLALLPGRAALLDSSGLVIAWSESSSSNSQYMAPVCETDAGLIVTPLDNTPGITLLWAPPADAGSAPGKRASHSSGACLAQICELTSRLMHAQENERKKIARELHDDLGQRLAAHALALGNLKNHPPSSSEELLERLLVLETDAVELGEAVRIASHELHPALLERLGLASALRSFAHEFCERAGLRHVLDIQEPPRPLPAMVEIATYRIVQEAVRNIERHAQASTVQLKLSFTPHHLHLVVQDDGIGFTTGDASTPKGLGLTSIEERVRLLNGRLSINGNCGCGTAITVQIPRIIPGP